jgi:hypothetical protein
MAPVSPPPNAAKTYYSSIANSVNPLLHTGIKGIPPKNVRNDGVIVELVLIKRRGDQRAEVVWDIVAAEMRLAA